MKSVGARPGFHDRTFMLTPVIISVKTSASAALRPKPSYTNP